MNDSLHTAQPRHLWQRRGVLAGVAVAAGLAGAGLAWYRLQPGELASGAMDGLWPRKFDRPEGGELSMAAFKGQPLLLNFWATWCPPCVEELPLLDRFYQENKAKGWQVVGLAIDQPSAVRAFLRRLPLSFPVGLAGLEGTALGRELGNATGALPFSVVVGRDGQLAHRKMGQITPSDLQSWLALR